MPKFTFEQYQVHVVTYTVNAGNIKEAVVRFLNGEVEETGVCSDFISVVNDVGILTSSVLSPEEIEEIKQRTGESFENDIIPGVVYLSPVKD